MNWLHRIAFAIGILAATPAATCQAAFPARPVKLINPAAAGSATDVVGRIVGEELGRLWRQAAVTENRPGGGGVVAAQAAVQAGADGHTLFFATASSLVIAPHLHSNLAYDPERDFIAIGFVTEVPLVIAVRPSLPAHSLKELISLASRNRHGLEYAANAQGTFPHLAGELFAQRAGIKLTFVPYKGAASALHDVAGGRLAMMIEGVSGISGALQAGQLRALAVTSEKRLPDFPELPSVSESIPQFSAVGWFALLAPAKTPSAVAARLHADLRAVLERDEVAIRLRALGSYPRYMTMEQLSDFIRRERALWGSVVKQIGLKPQ